MKKIFFIALTVIACLSGCKPEINGELGEPFDQVVGIKGEWVLTSFVQQDLNNPIKEERDFSEFYIQDGETPLTIDFASEDRSYSVDITSGKNFFGDAGTWSFDNDEFPTSIIFDDGITANLFTLGAPVRDFDNSLTIQIVKGCSDTDQNVIYKFNFTRAN